MKGRRNEAGGMGKSAHGRGRETRFEPLEPRQMLTAYVYPLANAGFEEPALDAGGSYSSSVPGWTEIGAVGITYEIPSAEASPASEGDQFLWGDSAGWSIRQTGPMIEANTRYILSVDLFPLTTGANQAVITLQDEFFFTLGSTAYQPSFDPGREDFELPAGEWTTVKLGINSALLSPATVGRDLNIIIEGAHLAVDNVELTVDDTVHDFYISSSSGSSANDGFSEQTPFGSFADLAPYGELMPGERILLKAGDVFTEELNLRGKGTETDLVELTSYGDGPNPIIRRLDVATDVGVIWNNASHARISHIDVEHSKLGIYLRYEFTDFGSTNVTIENCDFRDMTDPTLAAEDHNFEYAWSDAIWVGGQAFGDAEFATRLDGLTIRNVTATNVAHLFGTGWYFPAPYPSRLRNLVIEDSVAYNALAGAFQLFGVDGGRLTRVHSIGGGGQDTWSGTTLGFLQNTQNIIIEDSEFSYIDRAQSADGTGMDFEGDNHNITFRNNVVHSNAGSGLLILSTQGRNTNLIIENNVFYNNALDPWNDEINSEVQGSNDNHTGVFRNNTFYRRDTSINFFSPGADWSGFVFENNRELEYSDVRELETWWEFDSAGDFEGWSGFNQWTGATVTGGSLVGVSGGADPFVESPPTFVNTNTTGYAWIRMSQTAGDFGQLFYITETDPVWNAEKSVFFPITSDGQMHDYFVDFGSLPTTTGVITQVRLDPTIVAGSTMAIDFLRLTDSDDPNQTPPPAPLPDPQQLSFTSIAAEDGHVLESAQNSGVGGSTGASSTTFRLGDDSQNRAYRQFLSFDTSALPDNAIVTQVTIGITRVGNPVGTIPIGVADSPWGDLLVDLAAPGFGSSSLSVSDWESSATQLAVSKFAWPAYSNGMELYSRLDDPHTDLVNTAGTTQFRVRYENDDDGDFTADYMSYATSNYSVSSFRPQLTVQYYIPSGLTGDYDANGVVDGGDYNLWFASYGATGGTGLLADGNGDGVVNNLDYLVWRENEGQSIALSQARIETDEATVADAQQIAFETPRRFTLRLQSEGVPSRSFATPRSTSSEFRPASSRPTDLLLIDLAVKSIATSELEVAAAGVDLEETSQPETEVAIEDAFARFRGPRLALR